MSFKRILLVAAVSAACALVTTATVASLPADAEFSGMDTNGDGMITATEHADATTRMFKTMDANADGKVTAREMTAAHAKVVGKKAAPGEMSSADKIKVVDGNGDGVLTAAEHAAGSAKMFKSMDVILDGRISRGELASARAKLIERKK